ncbi:MAG: mechanosensitive ion channel, partial [Alcaligenaceae bacterium]
MFMEYLPAALQDRAGSWLIVVGFTVVAILAAIVIHRLLITVLRRVAHRRPFTSDATHAAFRSSQLSLILLAIRVVLGGAPPTLPFINTLSYAVTVAFIIALTWLAIQCIHSVGATIARLNPHDVSDNLRARSILTQTRVLTRSAVFIAALIGFAFVLLTLPGARQIGASLLASAGVAGLVAGIAARPVLANFIAGLQIALSQPIRLDDVLIVKGEWGKVEEITGMFVVVRIWDERRLIVPLQWFIENPFENWTHKSSSILGSVFLWLDFSVPTAAIRAEFERVCALSPLWDQRVCVMHVTDATDRAMQVRL